MIEISTDNSRIDVLTVHDFLCNRGKVAKRCETSRLRNLATAYSAGSTVSCRPFTFATRTRAPSAMATVDMAFHNSP